MTTDLHDQLYGRTKHAIHYRENCRNPASCGDAGPINAALKGQTL